MCILIIGLCLVDLSVGLLLVLPNLMYELDNSWILHDAVCKLNDYVQVSGMISIYTFKKIT